MEPVLFVRLLGRFAVAKDSCFADPIQIKTRKARALIAILAASPLQTIARDRLASLLWGNGPDRKARQSLRQALTSLRRELGGAEIVQSDPDVIRLVPGKLSVDVLQLKQWSESTDMADLKRAVALAQGEFLEGFEIDEEEFEAWLQSQRRHYSSITSGLLEQYARKCDVIGLGHAAVEAVERLLALDPLREDWQRIAIQIYARHRGPGEALSQGARFIQLLKRELDVPAEAQTLKLLDQIRRSEVASMDTSLPNAPPSIVPPPDLVLVSQPNAGSDDSVDIEGPGSVLGPSASPNARKYLVPVMVVIVALLAAAGSLVLSARIAHPNRESRDVTSASSISSDPWQPPGMPSNPGRGNTAQGMNSIISMAVLPFSTYGDTAGSLQIVADMITDDLINSLSRLPSIRVISSRSSRAYRSKSHDIAEIGAHLRVRYVLEGSIRAHDDKLSIEVALIDPATRLPVWTDRIEKLKSERPEVQDEIVGRLSRELQFDIYRVVSQNRSSESEADFLVYKGFAAIIAASERGPTSLDEAQEYFNQALAREPENERAIRGLGAYHVLVSAQLIASDPQSHLAQADKLLRRAIAKDAHDASAHFFMGLVHEARVELQDAIESYQRSLEISPSNALAYANMGHVLIATGKPYEGLKHIHYALKLSPSDPHRFHWLRFAGEAELELQHKDAALRYLGQSYSLNQRHPLTLRSLAAASAVFGAKSDAKKYLTVLKRVAPHISNERLLDRPAKLKSGQPQLFSGLKLAVTDP